MIGIARQAIALDLGVDLCAALFRVFQLLENDDASALAHDKTVPPLVPGARRRFRVIVEPRRQGPRGCKAGEPKAADRRLRAAGNHHIGIIECNQPGSIADRMGTGRAGRHHGMVRSLEAVAHRNMARGQVDQSRRDEERRELARPAFHEEAFAARNPLQAANARADHHAGSPGRFVAGGYPAGIFNRLVRRP